YKAAQRSSGKTVGATHFYTFVTEQSSPGETARHHLLASLGVEVHPILVENTYEVAWDHLIALLYPFFTH
ncbi:MAG TPA: hypothetical protein VFJ16_29890, partial [Longimicrobium sp.]|nr:hypothetical protein [Longimicrobium sp.]